MGHQQRSHTALMLLIFYCCCSNTQTSCHYWWHSAIVQNAENGHSDNFTPNVSLVIMIRCCYSSRGQFLKTVHSQEMHTKQYNNTGFQKGSADGAFQASSDIIPTATVSPNNAACVVRRLFILPVINCLH